LTSVSLSEISGSGPVVVKDPYALGSDLGLVHAVRIFEFRYRKDHFDAANNDILEIKISLWTYSFVVVMVRFNVGAWTQDGLCSSTRRESDVV
jgi:hypothetical protein